MNGQKNHTEDAINNIMIKIAYTCITNNYDTLKPITKEEGWRYICFTDDMNLESKDWEIVLLPRSDKLQRHVKLCPHQYLPKHDISVWVDGNLEIQCSLEDLIRDKNYCLMTHIERDNIYDELNACINRSKDDPKIMRAQVEHYKKEGLPRSGLVASGVMVRKNNKKNNKINEQWWEEVKKWSRRDQLSFPYVAWKNDFKYEVFHFLRGFKKTRHEKNRYN